MSLINKMLKDLEARDRAAGSGTPTQVVLDDLRPVRDTNTASSVPRLLMILLPLAAVAGIGAYYYLSMPGAPPRPLAATPAKVDAAPPQPVVQLERRDEPPAETAKAESAVVTPGPAAAAERPSTPSPVVVNEKSASTASKPVPSPKPAARTRTAAQPKPAPVPEPSEKVVIERSERPVMPYDQADERYRKAAQFMSQGRGEDARAMLSAALSIHPAHHAARELAAGLAMQSGRWREAEQLLAQGLKLAPTRLSFAQLLARAHLEQGDEARAIATLEGARSAATGNADYLSFLAALYQRAGRHADAVSAYRDAVDARAQDARSWLGLGISLEATQDVNAASQAYARALQLGTLDARLAQYAQQRLALLKK